MTDITIPKTDITIPPEALKAAARAHAMANEGHDEWWFLHVDKVRAAILAALNAWPGVFSAIRTEEGGVEWDNEGNAPECLVLPLTTENTDDKA